VAKFVYSLLLVASGFGVGLAFAAEVMLYRLHKLLVNDPTVIDRMWVKAGIIVTQGILVIRLAQLQSVDPTPWSWAYGAGLLVMTYGLARSVRTIIEQVAKNETK